MFAKNLIFVLFSLQLAGCASINSVSLTPIPANRSKVVKAEVSRTIFLAFNFDNDFVNPLVDKLKAQCPNGVISGILTKDEVTSYIIAHKRRVVASGFCSQGQASNANSKRTGASIEEN